MQISELMWESDCGILAVIDDRNRVIGVLTDRDSVAELEGIVSLNDIVLRAEKPNNKKPPQISFDDVWPPLFRRYALKNPGVHG